MRPPNSENLQYSRLHTIVKILILTFFVFTSFPNWSQTKSFPSIQGAGSYVTGGRGGIVVKVTNLNNSGTGSLRAALMMTVPRTIVFEVSGTITLTSAIELIQENSNFTVAGQTAPEGGITISNHLIQMGGGYNRPAQPCNNAIWRYIRFRNGRYNGQPDVREHNGFLSSGCQGLVFDHCSFSFCDDQAIAMGGDWGPLTDITIQRSTFSENATGIIVGLNPNYPTGDITSINNLFVDQGHRTPNAGGTLQYDIINNVYYNWGSRLTNANGGSPEINFIGNYLQPGDHTLNGSANKVQNINPDIYTANNYHPVYYPTPQLDDRNLWQNFYTNGSLSSSYFTTTMYPLLETPTVVSPFAAYTDVMQDVGANKYLNADGTFGVYQDSFDVLKINNAQNDISTNPYNKNWTLPTLPANTRPANYDTDDDGMADLWEMNTFGTLANNGTGDADGDGYTDLEEFLNGVDVPSTNGSQVSINSSDSDDIICEGDSVTLTATGAATYLWNTGETTESITVSPTSTDTYSVTGTHSDSSTSQDTVTITVNALPNANAGSDVETCQGTAVTLTASGGTSYQWSNGSTLQSIVVNPNVTTTYTVQVTQNGCTTSDSVIVTVNDQPTVDAGQDQTIFLGETAILTASGADTYLWSTGETTESITVNPTLDTSFSVTGYIGDCENTDTVTVFLLDDSVNANAGADVEICNGETVTLTATGGTTYLWNTGATTASINVSPNTTTIYTVTAFSPSGNNTDSDNVTVTVNDNPQADAGTDTTICLGETITLTATGGTSYLWNTGETTATITISPNATTTYSVEVFENNCSDIDQVTVTVNDIPTVDAGVDVTINEGESTTLTASGADTYLWSTGETSATISVTPNSTTTYSVTGYVNGCESTDEVIVTVNIETVVADAGENVTICSGESTVLVASGGTTYLWSTGETTQSITVSPATTTTYTVTAFNAAQTLSDSDDVIVTVNDLPVVDAGNDVTIIENDSTTLTATGADTYQWSTGETTASITVSPNSTTTYTVTGFLNGCEATDVVTVTVNLESVTADAGENVSICFGESTTLTATGGSSYLWSTGETTASIIVSPNSTTEYSVTAYNTNQTASDIDSVTVTVNDLPNTFAGNDVTIIEGESTTLTASGANTYVWSTGATSATIQVSPEITTVYSVTGFSNGCEFTDEVTVIVEPFEFTASAGGDQVICQGYATTLTASEGDSYLWSTGETTQSITVNPSNTQTYTVTVFSGPYQDDADVTVSVNPNPDVVIVNGDQVDILEGEFITLSATGANSYLWNNGATQPNIAVSPSVTTTYEVTGFINNCEDTKAVTVNVFENVIADAGEDVTICLQETVTLTATGGEEYLWNTGETTPTIEVSPESDTEYSVLVYNALSSDEAFVTVFVEECNAIQLPPENESFDFLVFQDTAQDVLKVKINGLQSVNAKGIMIYDISGKILHNESFRQADLENESEMLKEINTTPYARGVYIVRLDYDDTSIIKKIPIR